MRTIFSAVVVAVLLTLNVTQAIAQVAPNMPRIGLLTLGRPASGVAAFLQGLEELGYVEGKNIVIERRHYKGKRELLDQLAAELVHLRVDIIVPSGPTALRPVLKATKKIPVVMPNAGSDPVGEGFVKTLSQPGANATGIAIGAPGLGSKKMELLKEALPAVGSVVFMNPHKQPPFLQEYMDTAKALGVKFAVVNVRSSGDIDEFFAKMASDHPDAIIIERVSLTLRNAGKIEELALKNRLPTMNNHKVFVEKGGLMSYGVDYQANWRRAAVFVDKILKGANPAVLPVEPPQLEFVINLKTAEQLGVRIPPEILLEANEVIQ